MVRRIIFVNIAFGMDFYPGPSIILICLMNLGMIIYTGHNYNLLGKFRNRIEMFNEYMICCITFHMFCFTDWVKDENGNPDKRV